jgi:hypothetical protein
VVECTSILDRQSDVVDVSTDFLAEIVRFDLFEPGCPKLLVELGLSTSINHCGADLAATRASLLRARDALVGEGELDTDSEPIPLLGRSDRHDVVNLATFVCNLVKRASASAGCSPGEIARRASRRLAGSARPGSAEAV